MNEITRRGFLSAAAAGFLAAAGCSTTPQPTDDLLDYYPDPALLPTTQSSTRPGKLAARPRLNYQRIRPVELKGDLLNPHIGTTTFQRFNGDPVNQDEAWDDSHGPVTFAPVPASLHNKNYPDTTVAYCRWLWSVIEPEKGKIRWDILDGTLKTAQQRGQTCQMRLQPFIGDDLPAWYWKMGGTRQDHNYQPEHNNPAYIQHWGDLIKAFGNRYDGHPILESFDIAYGGPCGEGGGNATPQTATKLTDIYLKALPSTQLVAMLGTPGCIYAMGLERPIGWRADCFGDLRRLPAAQSNPELEWNHMYDAYPREVERDHAKNQWQRAPVTFETCWTVPYWDRAGWEIDFDLEQGLKYHPSVFMPKSCYIPEKWMDKILAFNRRLGYRFVMRQFDLPSLVSPGEKARMSVWIDNIGVAPIYRPYKLALRYRQNSAEFVVPFAEDIRRWMPDNSWFVEHAEIPPQLQAGPAQIDMAIVDQTNKPVVKLAIEGIGPDGWHPMCPIEIRAV